MLAGCFEDVGGTSDSGAGDGDSESGDSSPGDGDPGDGDGDTGDGDGDATGDGDPGDGDGDATGDGDPGDGDGDATGDGDGDATGDGDGDTSGDGDGDVEPTCGVVGTISCSDDVVVAGELCLGAPIEVASGVGIRNLAVFDFDLDGIDDVVVAQDINEALLLRGTPGGLSPFGNIGFGNKQQDVTVGDFNADGIPDVAALDVNREVRVRRGDGSGGFNFVGNIAGLQGLNLFAYTLGAGDFNGDNRDDVAVLYWSSIVVYLTNAMGVPSTPVEYPFPNSFQGGTQTVVADIDEVNGPDIVVGAYDSGNIGVLRNLGGANFADPVVFNNPPNGSSDGVRTLRVGDINQDVHLDVLADDWDTTAIYLHIGNNNPLLEQGTPLNVWGPGGFGLGDFDDDCAQDMAAHDGSNNSIKIYPNRNDGTGTFKVPVPLIYNFQDAPVEIMSGDFNGDGVTDLVVANSTKVFAYHSNP